MFYAIYIVIALAAGGAALALLSEAFAHEVSRVVEAAFDAVEYRLALWQRRRAIYARGGESGARASYPARAEVRV
ncbi:MAG TPA: hypothetical protein VM934_11925 [Pyrinomonadaceae bacterium]|nr:hypothetical protein [Pyrinomonadaceae bacterium]